MSKTASRAPSRLREGGVRCAIGDDVDHPPIVGAGLLALASAGTPTAALNHSRTELTP